MSTNRKIPRFIYIIGCDGTGKSTHASMLVNHMENEGIKNKHLWMRFPFFLSVPLLAYARLRGLSWRVKRGDVVHGYWNFQGSLLMEWIFPLVLVVDAALISVWKVYLPILFGYSIVCERYVLDMLADLAMATNNPHIFTSPIGLLFQKLIPPNNVKINLTLDPIIIRKRRKDLIHDRQLENRLGIYHQMSQALSIQTHSSQGPILEIQAEIRRRVGIK